MEFSQNLIFLVLSMVSLSGFLGQLNKRCRIYSVYNIFGGHLGKMNSFCTVPRILCKKVYSDYIYYTPNKIIYIIM